MRIGVVVLVVLLAGCVPDEENNNHGFGYAYDGTTELGVKYRNDVDGAELESEDIDEALENAAACLGVVPEARGLMVILTNALEGDNWQYQTPPPLILMKERGSYATQILLEHEMVHHLLYVSTGLVDSAHASGCYPHGTIPMQS